jgi:hypothetical protein
MPRNNGRIALLILGLALAVIAVVAMFATTTPSTPVQASAPPAAPASVPHFIDSSKPGAARILVIAAANQTLPGTSNSAGVLMANLRDGHIPTGATSAVVLSDSNCEPDADGISHCLNDLNIGGVVVTVQHHHNMGKVPCLSPGETITLMTLEQYQQNL